MGDDWLSVGRPAATGLPAVEKSGSEHHDGHQQIAIAVGVDQFNDVVRCAHDSDQQCHAEGSADLSEGVADSAANRESFRWEFRDAGPGVGRIEASDADADDDNEGHEQSRIAGLVEADRHGRCAHADGQHTGYRREAEPDSRGQAPAEGRQGGHGDRADEGDEPGLKDGVGPRLTEKQTLLRL